MIFMRTVKWVLLNFLAVDIVRAIYSVIYFSHLAYVNILDSFEVYPSLVHALLVKKLIIIIGL